MPQFFYILHKRIFSQVASQPLPMRVLFRWMKAFAGRIEKPALRRKLFSKIHKAIGEDLWMLASGGSRFDPRVAQDLSDLGYTMLQAYGLTETSAAATITPPQDNRIGTVGKPIRGVTVRVDSPNSPVVGVGDEQVPLSIHGDSTRSRKRGGRCGAGAASDTPRTPGAI